MAISPNRHASGDPMIARFRQYLMAERNVAAHTLESYAADLAQFASSKWGAERTPPYPWGELTEDDARAFVLAFTREGAKATIVVTIDILGQAVESSISPADCELVEKT